MELVMHVSIDKMYAMITKIEYKQNDYNNYSNTNNNHNGKSTALQLEHSTPHP